jgi:hypothetical protein
LLAEADVEANRASAKAATKEAAAKDAAAKEAANDAAKDMRQAVGGRGDGAGAGGIGSGGGNAAGTGGVAAGGGTAPGKATAAGSAVESAGAAGGFSADDLGGSLDDLFAELTKNDTPTGPSTVAGAAKADLPTAAGGLAGGTGSGGAVSIRPGDSSAAIAEELDDADARLVAEMLNDDSPAALAGDAGGLDAKIAAGTAGQAAGEASGGRGAMDPARAVHREADYAGANPAGSEHAAGEHDAAAHAASELSPTHPSGAPDVADPNTAAEAHAAAVGAELGTMEAPTFDSPGETLGEHHPNPPASKLSKVLDVLVTPLEWINAPMDAYPDSLREGLGWIGVVTFLNAVAVLLYVMLFRRH